MTRPALAAGLALLLAPSARATDAALEAAQHRAIRHFYDEQIFDPDNAKWQFDPAKDYPGGYTLICGHVDRENSNQVYLGPTRFYAILDGARVTESDMWTVPADDPGGGLLRKLKILCGGL